MAINGESGKLARFSAKVLRIDAAVVAGRLAQSIRETVGADLRRRGAVVGMSGGIDSSVVAGLCAMALGPERVLGVFMPEDDSDPQSLGLAGRVAENLGIPTVVEDIGPILRAAGCYQRRDAFIRQVFPEFGPGCKCKLALTGVAQTGGYNMTTLVAQWPDGRVQRCRPPLEVYLGIVAATNMKQRTRKQIEYYHADRLNYAVAGTPNRLEYDQGFFVKNGDGSADFKPIAHLYKTQVYQLAEALGIPEEIRLRPPTTDTFSMPQTQEEFYFALPYAAMDLCLYGLNHAIPAETVGEALNLSAEQVERVYKDIQAKRRATRYQHLPPLLLEEVEEVGDHG